MTSETFANITSSISNAIVAIATIVAAVFAVKGVDSYHKEFTVKGSIRACQTTSLRNLQGPRWVAHVRHAFMSVAEFPKPNGGDTPLDITSKQGNFKATSFAYQNRWEVLVTAMRELESEMTQAQVFWGPQFADLMQPVRECAISLQIAIENRLRSILGEEVYTDKKERAAERQVLYSMGELSKDPFGQKIQGALQAHRRNGATTFEANKGVQCTLSPWRDQRH
jgi:hypothetical protein